MILRNIIYYLYPNAVLLEDFQISNYGHADNISYWNSAKLGAQPTQAQIDSVWSIIELATAQKSQIEIISAGCAATIVSGFASSALGAAYTYPSKPTDQANLNTNVVSSILPGLPTTWTTEQLCADSNGVWAYRLHTAAQIQQAGADGKAAILACLLKNDNLRRQIMACTTEAEVAAITW